MDDDDAFRKREFEVHRLRRTDESFDELWQDYQDVRSVLGRLDANASASKIMWDDYLRLSSELTREIEDRLQDERKRRESG
ncbi:hypothetical protein [Salipiger sp. PrR003]|uniref:hypothetical protein n=1 Tax=Salipiger sp. PrR003 TaxID=2706776 RepID=UPI0013DCD159|nr:hypothetical protein [Salipiger sp. PrR003]NDV53016.1 hypothetical protein [Salipiger sp. PrR003]